jgi:hypothetical protein
MTIQIPLKHGLFAIVSKIDAERVLLLNWRAVKIGYSYYAVAYDPSSYDPEKGTWKNIFLHRFILNAPPGILVDHKNGNGLENSRDNIRLCTNTENQYNRTRLSSNNLSGNTGVSWLPKRNKWRSLIMCQGKKIYLGEFDLKEEAVAARQMAESVYFGEFAPIRQENIKLFLITQNENKGTGICVSAVVATKNEMAARNLHPVTGEQIIEWGSVKSWCNSPCKVQVKYLGLGTSDVSYGVVCSNYGNEP